MYLSVFLLFLFFDFSIHQSIVIFSFLLCNFLHSFIYLFFHYIHFFICLPIDLSLYFFNSSTFRLSILLYFYVLYKSIHHSIYFSSDLKCLFQYLIQTNVSVPLVNINPRINMHKNKSFYVIKSYEILFYIKEVCFMETFQTI